MYCVALLPVFVSDLCNRHLRQKAAKRRLPKSSRNRPRLDILENNPDKSAFEITARINPALSTGSNRIGTTNVAADTHLY